MNPDPVPSLHGFALLANGADFSCLVLQSLLRRRCVPDLMILPEYPPASTAITPTIETGGRPESRLLALAGNMDIDYAPEAQQDECASRVAARGIDFLLVACWPYLISPGLIAGAACAAINLHPSLLPKYRGADPLRQQAAAGDRRYGVTLHLLDGQFDHGDIVAQAETGAQDASLAEIETQLAELGVLLFIDALQAWPNWHPVAQARL
jgi:methionyl-tRNA formyltransferase